MSSSTSELVLISGINGFVATEIALAFLKAGYRVRGTVRSQAKADAWLALPTFAPYAASGVLETCLVGDITVPKAFDDALEDVAYFIHTIAKLPDWRPGVTQNYETDLLLPNINGTVEALKSAARRPAVKKVVVLGSVAAALDLSVPKHEQPIDEKCWNPTDYEYGKNAPHGLLAYATSKKLAEEAAWKYMSEAKPHFDLVTTLPVYVYGISHGHDPFGVNNSSNQWLAGALFRHDWDFAIAVGQSVCVDLEDVANAHVRAVERAEASGKRIILAPSYTSLCPSDFVPLFAREFPERAHLLPPVPSDLDNKPIYFCNATESEKVLGMKFRPQEDTVLRTARWMLQSGGVEAWAQVKSVYGA